jgi:hypothetical protein
MEFYGTTLNAMPMTSRDLLKPKAMASRLGFTDRHLRNLQKQRIVPFIKIKGLVLFDPDKVFAALEKFERKSL